jgi:hypothetical protein
VLCEQWKVRDYITGTDSLKKKKGETEKKVKKKEKEFDKIMKAVLKVPPEKKITKKKKGKE